MATGTARSPLQHALQRVTAFLEQAGRQRSQVRRADVSRLCSRVLARGASVHVLRWEGEELLVGCTEQSMVVLARRPAEPAAGEGA